MVVQLIQISCDFENIESFTIPTDHDWCLDIRLTNSDEVRENVTLCADDESDIPNSRGTANLVLSAGNNSYATVKIESGIKSLRSELASADGGKFVPVLAVDCRGCEVKAWKPTGFYQARSASGNVFNEVDLSEREWYDVDPETNEPVSITNVVTSIVNYKK